MKLKALVVDDHREAADVLRQVLMMLGCDEVQAAYSGEEALEIVQSSPPDLAMVDLRLPGINGYEVAAAFRENEALGHVYLVAFTGCGYDADKSHAFEVGFDQHALKPVEFDELAKIVKAARQWKAGFGSKK